MSVTFDELAMYISASKNVVDIFKTMSSFLPKGSETTDLEKRLTEAENALRAAESKLAQSLGYHLCKCTFPPQIMLMTGRHQAHDDEIFKCSNCGNQEPSEREFARKDSFRQGGRIRSSDF